MLLGCSGLPNSSLVGSPRGPHLVALASQPLRECNIYVTSLPGKWGMRPLSGRTAAPRSIVDFVRTCLAPPLPPMTPNRMALRSMLLCFVYYAPVEAQPDWLHHFAALSNKAYFAFGVFAWLFWAAAPVSPSTSSVEVAVHALVDAQGGSLRGRARIGCWQAIWRPGFLGNGGANLVRNLSCVVICCA